MDLLAFLALALVNNRLMVPACNTRSKEVNRASWCHLAVLRACSNQ